LISSNLALAQSAKVAAGAARKLSSLDEMAQNDDYVHSDGLRLSSGKKAISSASSSISDKSDLPSVVEDLSGRFVDAVSMAARKKHRSPTRAPDNNTTNSVDIGKKSSTNLNPNAKTKSTSANIQLLKSVAVLYDETNNVDAFKQYTGEEGRISSFNSSHTPCATIPTSIVGQQPDVQQHNIHTTKPNFLQELEYESDTDSSSDDERPKKQSQYDIEMTRPISVAINNEIECGITSGHVEKDVNRFMKMTNQLESEREMLIQSQKSWSESSSSTTTNDTNRMPTTNGTTTAPGDDTHRALKAGLSWIRNVASPQLETFSKQLLTKFSESDLVGSNQSNTGRKPMIGPRDNINPSTRKNDWQDDDERIIVSTSAAFLGEQDTAELERIRMRHNSATSGLAVLLQICIDNQRLVFVGATLVLSLFAYFYSRRRSVDGVL
jgi:hypothetical protein